MDEKIRTFIAIRLPETVLRGIGKVQDQLRKSGFSIRWVRMEGMHLTLKFLGNVDKGMVDVIRSALEESAKGVAPFVLRAKGIGVFPGLKRPRVVWIGVSGDVEVLSLLQSRLEACLEAQGFARETRRFKGHLTLGRAKGLVEQNKLQKALEKFRAFETESFSVDSVSLFQSTLRPQGAIHTRLAEVLLQDRPF
jgi:RNA 2',3'-cyclic 3'-phosphodiesterase